MDRKTVRTLKEAFYKWLFAILAFASLAFLIGIIITLLSESLPVFAKIRLTSFLFGEGAGIPPLILRKWAYGPSSRHHLP